MSDLLNIQFEYQNSPENPIKLKISADPTPDQTNEIDPTRLSKKLKKSQFLESLKSQIKDLEFKNKIFEKEQEAQLSRILELQKENKNLSTQLVLNETSKSSTQEVYSKQLEEIKDLKQKNQDNEKIIQTHFDLIEDLKSKYSADLKQKISDLEKKLNEVQKTLNVKTSQVSKLTQLLKEREHKRTSAELMLDEFEKKNDELLDKNLKLEKTIHDQEKKINELSKRLNSALTELKSSDEVTAQKDQQIKKLVAKIKIQENAILKLEEEVKIKDRKIFDAQQKQKISKSVDIRTGKNNKPDEVQKAWELVASKDEEINLMKDMLKSFQNKYVSPSSSKLSFVNKPKLPPLNSGTSSTASKEKIDVQKELIKVRSNFKIREIDSKGKSKPPALRKPERDLKQNTNNTPQKQSVLRENYEDTPKFKETLDLAEGENNEKTGLGEVKEVFQVFTIDEEGEKNGKDDKRREAEEKRMSFGMDIERGKELAGLTQEEEKIEKSENESEKYSDEEVSKDLVDDKGEYESDSN